MFDELRKAVETENQTELIKCLDFMNSGNIDLKCYEYIEKALIGTWHEQHEDLVNTIYLDHLIDDRFVEPLLEIAVNEEKYRPYDDEMESTLRKCVHALKTIDSKKSNEAIDKLIDLNNENVKFVLEMYK